MTEPDTRAISVELLSAIMSLNPDAALVVDSEGRVVAVNERAEDLFGYAPGGLAGLYVEALVPDRVRRRHRQYRSHFLGRPQSRLMGAGLELTGRRQDGSEFPLDISLAPLVYEGERLVVAAIRDMTEQRRATAAQAELATIVRSSFDAIISTTLEGKITNWNPAAEELLGYNRDDILGCHIATIVPSHASVVLEELLEAASEGGHRGGRDTRWRHRDGRELDIAVSISPLRDGSGMVRGFSAIARDIADRKAAENELRRLLAQEEHLQRQHAATAEIRLALLSGAPLKECLTLICDRASELVDCPVAVICVRDDQVRVAAAVGPAAAMVGVALPPGRSFAEQVIERREPIEIARRSHNSTVEVPELMPDGPTLGVPITVGGVAAGSLTLVRYPDGGPYSPAVRVFAESLAAQASLAFEFERARLDREEMALIGDRERIARDLHDHVIQRLFAAGMRLQSSTALTDEPRLQKRLSDTVEQLDDTIREIRNTIFGLSMPLHGGSGLRSRIMELARQSEVALGFAPSVVFDGAIDSGVPDRVTPHLLACVSECLSNAARHAQASAVSLQVVLTSEWLTLTVTDNGGGMGTPSRTSGLANLKERARLLQGTFEASAPTKGGTMVEWRVKAGPERDR